MGLFTSSGESRVRRGPRAVVMVIVTGAVVIGAIAITLVVSPRRAPSPPGGPRAGPQVRPLGGLSPWPASSSRQTKAPRSRAALYIGPHLGLPHRDRALVAFQRLADRHLGRPAMPKLGPHLALSGSVGGGYRGLALQGGRDCLGEFGAADEQEGDRDGG